MGSIRTPPHLTLTHQANVELEGMHNPGGFTDGDRALCFIHALGVRSKRLVCWFPNRCRGSGQGQPILTKEAQIGMDEGVDATSWC